VFTVHCTSHSIATFQSRDMVYLRSVKICVNSICHSSPLVGLGALRARQQGAPAFESLITCKMGRCAHPPPPPTPISTQCLPARLMIYSIEKILKNPHSGGKSSNVEAALYTIQSRQNYLILCYSTF
jgi:hypothetical protein